MSIRESYGNIFIANFGLGDQTTCVYQFVIYK